MLAALRLEETDRIPIGLRGVDPYGDLALVGSEGVPLDPSYDPLMDLARKKLDIWHSWSPKRTGEDAFRSTSRGVKSRTDKYVEGDHEYRRRVIETPKGTLSEIHKRRKSVSEKAYRCVKHLIETDKDLEAYLSIPYEPVKKLDISPFYKEKKRIGEAGVLMTGVPTPIGFSGLFRFQDFVKRMMTDRETMVNLADIMFERCYDYTVQLLEAGAREVFQVGGEIVAPPLFNPSYFRDFVVKYHSKIFKLIHEYDGIVYFHCHGSINAILEMFAEMGTDAIHPVEPPPMGDTPLSEAKRKIGDKVCFIGNIQISDILSGSTEQVDRAVRQAIYEGGPEGLILSTSASPSWYPLPQRALKNYVQLTETGLQYGKLPRR